MYSYNINGIYNLDINNYVRKFPEAQYWCDKISDQAVVIATE